MKHSVTSLLNHGALTAATLLPITKDIDASGCRGSTYNYSGIARGGRSLIACAHCSATLLHLFADSAGAKDAPETDASHG